jgi:hypothetical protein
MDPRTEELKETLRNLHVQTAEDIVVRRLQTKMKPVESASKELYQPELRLLTPEE